MATPVVIDNGSKTCKAGLAGDTKPRAVFTAKNALKKFPLENGLVTDWDEMVKVWQHAYQNELKVSARDQPLLLTESPLNTQQNRERMTQVVFEKLGVPSYQVAIRGVLALYANGQLSGVVCESGDGVTHIVPITNGNMVHGCATRVDVTGENLTQYMSKLLRQNDIAIDDMGVVQDIKEKTCEVALDFDKQLTVRAEKSYSLPDGRSVTIGNERLRCPEAMFQPQLISKDTAGIHQHIQNTIAKCDPSIRQTLYNKIILAGGNTMYPGFIERLSMEMTSLAPDDVTVDVVGFHTRNHAAFIGGAVLASLPDFAPKWITKQEYEEHGPGIMQKKSLA